MGQNGLFATGGPKVVLLDFDGTLAFRDGGWSDAIVATLRAEGVTSVTADDIRRVAVRAAGIPAILVRRPTTEGYRWYAETLSSATAMLVRQAAGT